MLPPHQSFFPNSHLLVAVSTPTQVVKWLQNVPIQHRLAGGKLNSDLSKYLLIKCMNFLGQCCTVVTTVKISIRNGVVPQRLLFFSLMPSRHFGAAVGGCCNAYCNTRR